MEISRYRNNDGTYDYELKKDDKTLRILFGGNLDLYLSLSDGKMYDDRHNASITFDITKEDYEIFELIDNLYYDTITANIHGKRDEDYEIDYSLIHQYKSLVYDKKIHWISDEGPRDVEDSFELSKIDEDTYRFTFLRTDKPLDFGFKSPTSISVRIRNSGSNYAPFNCIFMRMYNNLQEVDPEYHQIHIEEYQYKKKMKP